MEEADDTATGDQPLLLREPKTEIVLPEITRSLADFQTFAAKHSVSLVRININELMDELAKRGSLLAGDAICADVVWAPLESSVMTGFWGKAYNTYYSFTVLLRKYRVGIHVHILHLQVFTPDVSQNHEVVLGKQVQIINICLTFALSISPMFKI